MVEVKSTELPLIEVTAENKASLEFFQRLYNEIPVVNSTLALTRQLYASAKGITPVTIGALESAVSKVSHNVRPYAEKVQEKYQPQIQQVDMFSVRVLDRVEQKLPFVTKPVDVVINDVLDTSANLVDYYLPAEAEVTEVPENGAASDDGASVAKEEPQAPLSRVIKLGSTVSTRLQKRALPKKLVSEIDVQAKRLLQELEHLQGAVKTYTSKFAVSASNSPYVLQTRLNNFVADMRLSLGDLVEKFNGLDFSNTANPTIAKINEVLTNLKQLLTEQSAKIISRDTVDQQLAALQPVVAEIIASLEHLKENMNAFMAHTPLSQSSSVSSDLASDSHTPPLSLIHI